MRRLRPAAGLLAALLAWQALARALDTRALPGPAEVALALAGLVQGGALPRALGLTLAHAALGLGASLALAVPLGLWMGRSRAARAFFAPTMELLRPLPPPALLAPAMLLLGFGPGLYAVVVGFAAFFPLLLAARDAARAVPEPLLDAARTLGAGRARLALAVVAPACLPGLATGLRMALPVALIVAVLAEMVGGDGAGRLLLRLQRTWRIPEMYACVAALGLAGWALSAGLTRAARRLLRWSGPWRGHHPRNEEEPCP